jgi:hypothetical protein
VCPRTCKKPGFDKILAGSLLILCMDSLGEQSFYHLIEGEGGTVFGLYKY